MSRPVWKQFSLVVTNISLPVLYRDAAINNSGELLQYSDPDSSKVETDIQLTSRTTKDGIIVQPGTWDVDLYLTCDDKSQNVGSNIRRSMAVRFYMSPISNNAPNTSNPLDIRDYLGYWRNHSNLSAVSYTARTRIDFTEASTLSIRVSRRGGSSTDSQPSSQIIHSGGSVTIAAAAAKAPTGTAGEGKILINNVWTDAVVTSYSDSDTYVAGQTVILTQAQYDAITSKVAGVRYAISG